MDQAGILFVDDEPNVLRALRRTLRKESYRCFFAEGPEEALDLLREESIDLIVADHLMPTMDGLTLLKLVRSMYPGVLRVILTGQADLKMAMEAINEGEVSRFLTKPWLDVELRMTLKQLVDFIDLRRENQLLNDQVQKQQLFLERLSTEHPGILQVERDESGAVVIDMDLFEG